MTSSFASQLSVWRRDVCALVVAALHHQRRYRHSFPHLVSSASPFLTSSCKGETLSTQFVRGGHNALWATPVTTLLPLPLPLFLSFSLTSSSICSASLHLLRVDSSRCGLPRRPIVTTFSISQPFVSSHKLFVVSDARRHVDQCTACARAAGVRDEPQECRASSSLSPHLVVDSQIESARPSSPGVVETKSSSARRPCAPRCRHSSRSDVPLLLSFPQRRLCVHKPHRWCVVASSPSRRQPLLFRRPSHLRRRQTSLRSPCPRRRPQRRRRRRRRRAHFAPQRRRCRCRRASSRAFIDSVGRARAASPSTPFGTIRRAPPSSATVRCPNALSCVARRFREPPN